ncbi:hypothetical protein [Erythrobacter sp.]|uniref:hypothetical protein n=1 Tax=Erythrobacter sp. TaxID=1042 RepID=UPI001B144AE3|nr:hypothetical protein [Erythrobacter sp.]MBO6525978.1 hypothetical protein [Erythrobacter sp.]MBO6529347.1 hypothetical protein [Erythrobacter sp.]
MPFRPQLLALPLAAAMLGGCDVATDMAGDAIKGEIRSQFIQQCEQIASDNGFAGDLVTTACECSADKFSADAADGELDINRDRIEEVLKTCVQAQPGEPAGESAEAING